MGSPEQDKSECGLRVSSRELPGRLVTTDACSSRLVIGISKDRAREPTLNKFLGDSLCMAKLENRSKETQSFLCFSSQSLEIRPLRKKSLIWIKAEYSINIWWSTKCTLWERILSLPFSLSCQKSWSHIWLQLQKFCRPSWLVFLSSFFFHSQIFTVIFSLVLIFTFYLFSAIILFYGFYKHSQILCGIKWGINK